MPDTDLDRALGFIIPARNARGRIVRIGPVLESILGAHGYPPVIEALLAEALAITALLGAMLKDNQGQLTMQAQTQTGPVSLMVCDYAGGLLRGYVQHDPELVASLPKSPDLRALFGEGYLAITFDQAVSGERYQGIVPLEGACLAAAVESYFYQSEQIPSLVRVAVEGDVAGAMLIQHLPDGEDGRDRIHTRLDHPEWEHVAIMGGTVSDAELTDPALGFEAILWRLFNEEDEVRILAGIALDKGCRCDPAHIRKVLLQFPAADRDAMRGDDGIIRVDCAFCARSFPVSSLD